MKNGWFLIPVFALCVGIPLTDAKAQANAPAITIMDIDSSQFPTIRVRFFATDSKGMPMANLEREAIRVVEDTSMVDFRLASSNIGIQAGYVADMGAGISALGATGIPRRSEMQGALEFLFSKPWMLSGQDTFFLSLQEASGTRTLTGATHDSLQLKEAIQRYEGQEDSGFSDGLAGINAALDFFANTPNEKGQYRTIIFLSSGLQTGGEKELNKVITQARMSGIPIQTILFRQESDSPFGVALQMLARQTGGQYGFFNEHGNSSVQALSDRLEAYRNQYSVLYRSKRKESGTQVIQLGLQMAGASAPAVGKYELDVQAPTVAITDPPEGGALELSAFEEPDPAQESDATPVVTPTPEMAYVVEGSVSWPDGHARNLASAELWMNGKPLARWEGPETLRFRIPPQAIKAARGSRVLIQIRVTDELGITSASSEVDVSLGAPSTSGCASLPAALQRIFCPASTARKTTNTAPGFLLPVLILVAILSGAGYLLICRRPTKSEFSHAPEEGFRARKELSQTFRFRKRPSLPKAYLSDLDGTSGLPRAMVELFGTTSIGRSRKHAETVLHAENSASALSRLHCIILEEEDEFFVRDEQSANGTYLNGVRLVPLERNGVKEGDEIELAKASQGGVRFRFQRMRPEGKRSVEAVSENSDATQYAGRK